MKTRCSRAHCAGHSSSGMSISSQSGHHTSSALRHDQRMPMFPSASGTMSWNMCGGAARSGCVGCSSKTDPSGVASEGSVSTASSRGVGASAADGVSRFGGASGSGVSPDEASFVPESTSGPSPESASTVPPTTPESRAALLHPAAEVAATTTSTPARRTARPRQATARALIASPAHGRGRGPRSCCLRSSSRSTHHNARSSKPRGQRASRGRRRPGRWTRP